MGVPNGKSVTNQLQPKKEAMAVGNNVLKLAGETYHSDEFKLFPFLASYITVV